MMDALVIGAGPAGLMASEILAINGFSVGVADAKPSVGRKFLMAGKSGLNLTKDEADDRFMQTYGAAKPFLYKALSDFGPQDVKAWAEDLEQPIFTGSTGRVFPKSMKASPLLRAWLQRLAGKGVVFHTRWRWSSWQDGHFHFSTPDGEQIITPKVTVLALGGASWSRLGSDGEWANLMAQHGIHITPFQPANMGITVEWSAHMEPLFGTPLKNLAITVGAQTSHGECVISRRGLEGSLIYQFSRPFRALEPMFADLLPGRSLDQVETLIARQSRKSSLPNLLRKALRLDPAKSALVMEFARDTPREQLGKALKNLPIPYTGTAPLDAAISVAGGIQQADLTDDFMLKSAPGVFCAGEMLDWEAPTGGYLITACLATGRTAGKAAVAYLSKS